MSEPNDETDIYEPDLKQVEEWLEYSPEYVITIIGTSIWDDISYVCRDLKVFRILLSPFLKKR